MKSLAVILLVVCASVSSAATFVEDFESGILNPNLFVTKDPSFGLTFSGGKAVFDRTAGIGNERMLLTTNFRALGDFTVTVEANRLGLGTGSLGLTADDFFYDGTVATDIYFQPSAVQANVFSSGLFTDELIGIGSNTATFRIRRSGNTVFDDVDFGGGFITLNSRTDTNLSTPMSFGLFLFEEIGASDDLIGTFDNWNIEADQFIYDVPEPISITLVVLSALFCLRRRYTNTVVAQESLRRVPLSFVKPNYCVIPRH